MADLPKDDRGFTDVFVTRQSLIIKATDGTDSKAWEELVGYYKPFVKQILIGLGFRHHDLDDACQQVFLKLWNGFTNYRKENATSGFRGWFSRLIRNAAIDWLRSQRKKDAPLSTEGPGLPELEDDSSVLEEKIEAEWREYVVELAMERLKDVFSGKAFEVFALSLKGVSAQDIAGQLSIRVESVYVLKTRIKNRLQREIAAVRRDLEFMDNE